MEQSSILSAKLDCPVAHQNFSLLATVHDGETGLWSGSVEEYKKYFQTIMSKDWFTDKYVINRSKTYLS